MMNIPKQGDLIWVPSQFIRNITMDSYWPAQFKKMMNLDNICMVSLYSYEDQDEFFPEIIVELSAIKRFDDFLPSDMTKFCRKAFDKALEQEKTNISGSKKIKINKINSARQLVTILKEIYKCLCLEEFSRDKNCGTIPELLTDSFPCECSDLKIYFQNQVPQLLLFILHQSPSENYKKTLKVLQKIRNSIKEKIIEAAKTNSINFSYYQT